MHVSESIKNRFYWGRTLHAELFFVSLHANRVFPVVSSEIHTKRYWTIALTYLFATIYLRQQIYYPDRCKPRIFFGSKFISQLMKIDKQKSYLRGVSDENISGSFIPFCFHSKNLSKLELACSQSQAFNGDIRRLS